MDIGSKTALMPGYESTMQAHHNYADIQGLNNLKLQAREDQRAALQPVAEQFEALFVQQIFKEARKVSFDDGWLDGGQGEFYKDWHDSQLAQDLAAKGSLGFADTIVEQLLPSIPNIGNTTEDKTHNGNQKLSESVEKSDLKQPTTEDFLALKSIR